MSSLLSLIARMNLMRAMLFGVILSMGYFFLFSEVDKELQAELVRLDQQITELKSKIEEGKKSQEQLQQLQSEFDVAKQKAEGLYSVVAPFQDVQDIGSVAQKFAKTAGISLSKLDAQAPIPSSQFEELPLHFVAEGNFSDVAMWMFYLSSADRLINWKSFTMVPVDPKYKNGRIKFEGYISGYKRSGGVQP